MSIYKCSKCNSEVKHGVKFCSECGAELEWSKNKKIIVQETKKFNEDVKQNIKGGLLGWSIITVVFIIENILNPATWIIIVVPLSIALVMVLSARGTRWFMIIVGFILGAFSLYAACTITSDTVFLSKCLYDGCVSLDPNDASFAQEAMEGRINGFIYSAYMFGSSIYFITSSRVKARFSGKSKAKIDATTKNNENISTSDDTDYEDDTDDDI